MLKKTLRAGLLLSGASLFTLALAAQQPTAPQPNAPAHRLKSDFAVLLNFEHAQVAQTGTPGFWLKGGSADASVTLWKGLGVAANLTGEYTGNTLNNIALGKVAFMAGPRYSFDSSRFSRKRSSLLFAEALFGAAHGFNSAFPGIGGVEPSADSFSMQMGGGADVAIARGFGLRAIELDWVHTGLPNNASNSQNDFRVATGISYRK